MPKIPFLTSDVPRDLRQFADRVREALDELKKKSDESVTLEDLTDAGVVEYDPNTGITPGPGVLGKYQSPPPPQNLKADGALANIILDWKPPTYLGHAHTEVWAAQERVGGGVPALGNAVVVGQTPGNVFTHGIGGGATRWYWIRFVNIVGEKGPFNAVVGTKGETGKSPEYLLDLLEGEVTETQLFKTLGGRIDLIDADASVAGSVSARVQQEATERASEDSALASLITTVQATADDNTASIQTEADTRAEETGDLFAQYTVKIDLNGYVSGYGLASSVVDGVPTSSFIVRADSFAVGTPGGTSPAPSTPFIVRTTPTTINGESVPAGVYMREAFIADGTIDRAKIGNAAIDTAKIANAAITDAKISSLDAGTITTGELSASRIDTAQIAADAAFLTNLTVDTAQIANAAIDTAKIADLAVDSLKIAGNAVSYSRYYSLGSDHLGDGQWDAVFSKVIFAPGGEVTRVFFAVDFEQGYYGQRDWGFRITTHTGYEKKRPAMTEMTDFATVTGSFELDRTGLGDLLTGGITVEWRGEAEGGSGNTITLRSGTTLTLEVSYK